MNTTKIIVETKDSKFIPKYDSYIILKEYINRCESDIHKILLYQNDVYKVYLTRNNNPYDNRLEFHNFSNLKSSWEIEFVFIEDWIEKAFEVPEVIKDNFRRYLQKWYPLNWIKNSRWTLLVRSINCELFANMLLWHTDEKFDVDKYDFEKKWNVLWVIESDSELIPWDVIITIPETLILPDNWSKKILNNINKILNLSKKIPDTEDIKDLSLKHIKNKPYFKNFHFAVYLWNGMFLSKMWFKMEVSITDLYFLKKRFDVWTIIRLQSKFTEIK